MPNSDKGRGPASDKKAGPSDPPAKSTSSSHVVQPPDAEALDGIVSEGERERLALARRAGHAVFSDPASVTPRVLALLGEVGLAKFVQQIRADADWFVMREREEHQAEGSVGAGNRLGKTTGPPTVKRPPRYRRPAEFGRAAPSAKPSERGAGSVLPALRTFLADAGLYSLIAFVALAVLIMGARIYALSSN